MICPYCGQEISDLAVVCPKCGVSIENTTYTNNEQREEKANGGFIALSIFFPIVGLILGIVEINKGNKKAGKTYIWAAVISWAVWFLLGCCIGVVPVILGLGATANTATSTYTHSYALIPLLLNI